MTTFIGVDLAMTHSGAVMLSSEGEVLMETVRHETSRRTMHRWVEAWPRALPDDGPVHVCVEEIPPGMAHTSSYKDGIRAQGALELSIELHIPHATIDFVMPGVWQKQLGYRPIPGQTTKGWAKDLCETMGYVAPSWCRGQGKSAEDLRDAALIAAWAAKVTGLTRRPQAAAG